MPSCLLTAASGSPFPLISGNFWSGQAPPRPQGGVQLKLANNSSGNAYISLSGGCTVNSGSFFLSGVNTTDGFSIAPGDSYWVPRLGAVPALSSGSLNIFVTCDPAGSGQSRLFFEVF